MLYIMNQQLTVQVNWFSARRSRVITVKWCNLSQLKAEP